MSTFNGTGDFCETLFTREQIAQRVQEMGAQISRDYAGQQLLLVGVLRGSVAFFADLMRTLDLDVQLDFIAAESYGSGTVTSGNVRITQDLRTDIENRHVLLVEDLLDTGTTLQALKRQLMSRRPASLKLCVFLDKTERRKVDIEAEYVGYEIPDRFVVGYGMDFAQHYRALPDIGVLKAELYEN